MSNQQLQQDPEWQRKRGGSGHQDARGMARARPRRWVAVVLLLVLLISALRVSATETAKPTGADIYGRSNDTVFYLKAEREDGSLLSFGSGFVVRNNGIALTAAHVVKGAFKLAATLGNGAEFAVQVLYQNDVTDIAVLQLVGTGEFQYIPFNGKLPSAGEDVFAIGYPSQPTKLITNGIISAVSGKVNSRDWMMMTAATVPGMSGGPVLDENGIAVGIVSGSIRTMAGINISPVTSEIIRVLNSVDAQLNNTTLY